MSVKRKSDEPCLRTRKYVKKGITLATVSRELRRMKPEIRQESYNLTIGGGAVDPLQLIIRGTLADPGTQEIRLSRIRLSYVYIPGDPLWGTLYGTKGVSTPLAPLSNNLNGYDIQNFLSPPDATLTSVYKSRNLSGTNKLLASDVNQIVELDHKFSIPKRIRFQNELVNTIPANFIGDPIYYIGGHRHPSINRIVRVTIWYTSN